MHMLIYVYQHKHQHKNIKFSPELKICCKGSSMAGNASPEAMMSRRIHPIELIRGIHFPPVVFITGLLINTGPRVHVCKTCEKGKRVKLVGRWADWVKAFFRQ